MEDIVQRMRKDVTTSAAGKDVNSFRVSYVSDSAEKARKVTERLASLYIEQNLKDRENQADSTSQFLTTQLDEAKRRLIEQEKKLEEYRKSHAGQLPSQLQGNLQAIQTASLQLQSLNESTNRAQERRLLIERQIADTQAVPAARTALPVARRMSRPAPRSNSSWRARVSPSSCSATPPITRRSSACSGRSPNWPPSWKAKRRSAAEEQKKSAHARRGRAAEKDSRLSGGVGGD